MRNHSGGSVTRLYSKTQFSKLTGRKKRKMHWCPHFASEVRGPEGAAVGFLLSGELSGEDRITVEVGAIKKRAQWLLLQRTCVQFLAPAWQRNCLET